MSEYLLPFSEEAMISLRLATLCLTDDTPLLLSFPAEGVIARSRASRHELKSRVPCITLRP